MIIYIVMEGGDKTITEQSEFQVLLIKPNDVSGLDFNNVNYITDLLNMDCLETIETDSDKIAHTFSEYLNPTNLDNCIAVTNICYETYDKIYEICFLDVPKTGQNNIYHTQANFNEIATMLDISEEKIYGNALLLKTDLPINNFSMKLINSEKKDIRQIFESRKEHIGVFLNEDGDMEEMKFREIKPKLKELFGNLDDVTKFEIPFLKHNFTMYYIKNSYENENKLVKHIAENNIYGDVFITSMLTSSLFTNISSLEVKQILEISKCNPLFWKSDQNFDEVKRDDLERNIIKSKFRILYHKYQHVLANKLNVD
jgi:hypothetical protein